MTASPGRPVPTVSVPDIRDYERINAELVQRLDEGHSLVRLSGAEGQRLLAYGLSGSWRASVEIEGHAGPELAAEVDAPGLTIICRGNSADGAGRGLRSGRLLILGDAGAGLGYTQTGGAILAAGAAGPRAGLGQRGGTLVVLGDVGQLAGERQSGGALLAFAGRLGPHAGRGRSGGQLVLMKPDGDPVAGLEPEIAASYRALQEELAAWTIRTEDDPPRR